MDRKELIFLATCIFIAQTKMNYDLLNQPGIDAFKKHFTAYQRIFEDIYDSPSE